MQISESVAQLKQKDEEVVSHKQGKVTFVQNKISEDLIGDKEVQSKLQDIKSYLASLDTDLNAWQYQRLADLEVADIETQK